MADKPDLGRTMHGGCAPARQRTAGSAAGRHVEIRALRGRGARRAWQAAEFSQGTQLVQVATPVENSKPS